MLVILEAYGGNKTQINKINMYEEYQESEDNILEESERKDNISKTDNSKLNKKIYTSALEQVYYEEPKPREDVRKLFN